MLDVFCNSNCDEGIKGGRAEGLFCSAEEMSLEDEARDASGAEIFCKLSTVFEGDDELVAGEEEGREERAAVSSERRDGGAVER